MSKSQFTRQLTIAICFAACYFLVPVASSHADLTPNQIKVLEQEFLPAWFQEDPAAILKSMNKAIRTMDDKQLEELDDLLAHKNMPGSGEILLNARLAILKLNPEQKLPKPGLLELFSILDFTKHAIEKVLNDTSDTAALLRTTNEKTSFYEIDNVLRRADIAGQQLREALPLGQQAVALLMKKDEILKGNLDERQRALVRACFEIAF